MRKSGIWPIIVLLAAGWLSSGAVEAANECRVRYTWYSGGNQQNTIYIDLGKTADINKGSALKVENLKSNSVRVYRTGFGSHVDLGSGQADPGFGNYQPGITLQKVTCLASGDSPPSLTQQAANAFFSAVSSFSDSTLGQLNTWKNQAQSASNKAIEDWGSCPSPGAQATYNQIKSRRDSAQQSLDQAIQIREAAEQALATCQESSGNSPLCGSTFNTLSVHAAITAFTGARNTLNSALTALSSLQCPQGCSQSASFEAPTPTLSSQGYWRLTNPGWVRGRFCSELDLGSVGFNTGALSSGNLGQLINATPPRCTRTEAFAICTNWDLERLLALLKQLKIVPPSAGKITVNVPKGTVTVPTGLTPTTCVQPLRVCVPGGDVTVSVNQGLPFFNGSYKSCASYLTVGCRVPAYGQRVVTKDYEIPDLTKARVSWTGGRPGSITVDLSKKDFEGLCLGRGQSSLKIPKPPKIGLTKTRFDVPFLCTQTNWVNLVANP